MAINLNDKTNKSIADLASKIMQEQPTKVREFTDTKPIESDMVQRVMNTGLKGNFIKEETKSVWDTSVDVKAHGDEKPTHTVHLIQHPKGTSGWRGSPRTLKVHVAAKDDAEAIQHATAAASHHHDSSHDGEKWEKPFVPSNPMLMAHPVKRLKEEEQVEEDTRLPPKFYKKVVDKLNKKKAGMKEEVEQIDEVGDTPKGRTALASYVKSAAGQVRPLHSLGTEFEKDETKHAKTALKAKTAKSRQNAIDDKEAAGRLSLRFKKRAENRVTGIQRAAARLANEGYNQARSQGTAYGRRDISGNDSFKRRELESELGHEENIPHAVAIDGRHWKTFPSVSHATRVAKSLMAKGKKASVYIPEAWKEDGHMSDEQMKKREEIVMGMKPVSKWEKRYPGRGKEVMYATATKMAMKEEQLGEEEMEKIIGEAADLRGIVSNWHKMSDRAKKVLMDRHGEKLKTALGSQATTTTGGQAKQAPKKPDTSSTVAALTKSFGGGEKKEGPKPKSKSLADIRAENIRRTKAAQEKGIAHGNPQSRAGGNVGENPDARDKESDLVKSSHEIAGEKEAAKGGTKGAIVGGSLKADKTAKERKPGEDDEKKLDEAQALKGKQHVLDVAAPKGKLTAADFKRLRAMRKGK